MRHRCNSISSLTHSSPGPYLRPMLIRTALQLKQIKQCPGVGNLSSDAARGARLSTTPDVSIRSNTTPLFVPFPPPLRRHLQRVVHPFLSG
ncbi:hypothetical protein CDAR_85451 [Caerostris darwini]|uniref:Uncharacterized protein n=1 Tax=Caerostris darwini TaxID=1538125 RepID=A0AAV4R060_9ARAC|nr:hypothetical protein CDAR_85451 [Caerostris darwini]